MSFFNGSGSSRRARIGLAVAVAALVALAGCGGSSDSDKPGNGAAPSGTVVQDATITVGLPEEIPTLDPQAREFYGIAAIVNWNIYEALLTRDDQGQLSPLLASDMPTQVDDTTWEFKLREGVTFTNGEPFNAEAAAASIKRIIDPKYASEKLPRLSTIAGATAVDEYTLDVTTKTPDPILPARMELVMMVPPKASQEPGFDKKPVGTGPYVWKSGIGSGPIEIEANPDYWGEADPTITHVIFKVIPDVSTQISSLQAGEIDLLMRLGADQAGSVPQVLTAAGLENNVVTLNSAAGLTRDPRVRQALNYAVDKDALADDLWSGYADVAKCQAIAPSAFGYAPDLEPYPYDPDKAKELLDEAGATGKTVTLVTADGVFPQGKEMGEVIASYWEAVGLKVDLKVPEFDPYLDALYAKGEDRPDGVYLSTTTELGDADSVVQRIYVSTADIAGYDNSEVDDLATQAASELDPSTREQLYTQLLGTACDDAAAVFLLAPQELYGASERLAFTPRADAKILYADMNVVE